METRVPAKSLVTRLKTNIRGYIVRGLLVIVPVGVTIYVLMLCYGLTAAHLTPFIKRYVFYVPDFMVPVISVVLFFSLLYLIGFLAAWVVGRRFIALGESLLRNIPLVKTIYTASKQAVDVLNVQDQAAAYEAAVMVNFPFDGSRAMAFVTGKSEIEGRGLFYRVFIPTTPNPTSGYFLFYPAAQVRQTGMPVQDAVKAVISAGIVTPEVLQLSPAEVSIPTALGEVRDASALEAPKEQRSIWETIKHLLRKRMFSGFLVIVPLGITAFVMSVLYNFTAGRITGGVMYLAALLDRVYLRQGGAAPVARPLMESWPPLATAILSVVLFFLLLYSTGYIATAVVGARIIRLGEMIIDRIPFVTGIYSATKQIAEALLKKNSGPNLKLAVFVEFPYRGVHAIGFVVGMQETSEGKTFFKLFVPTSPNITVGLLQFYEAQDLYMGPLTVEDAIKMVVSGGIIGPPRISLRCMDDLSREEIEALLAAPPEEDEE